METRTDRVEGLEANAARLVVARLPGEHRVGVAALGLDLAHELEGAPAPPEGQPVDHAPQETVARGVARVDHLDREDHRRVLGPARVVLHQRPDASGRVRH